jgi:hypothetical protein
MKRITVSLKRGTTAYNVKLGQPVQFLRVAAIPGNSNWVQIKLLVLPDQVADACDYYVLGEGDRLADGINPGKYLGSAGDLDVFSPCFV